MFATRVFTCRSRGPWPIPQLVIVRRPISLFVYSWSARIERSGRKLVPTAVAPAGCKSMTHSKHRYIIGEGNSCEAYLPQPTGQPSNRPTSQPISRPASPASPTQPPSHPTHQPPSQPVARGGSVSYRSKWPKTGGCRRDPRSLQKRRVLPLSFDVLRTS